MALYGLPGLPLAAVTLPVYVHIPTFYAVEVGLGLGAVGAILLFARLWDAVTDPLVGFLSDRTGGRFGQRKPWLLAGALLTALTGYLLLNPPAGASSAYLLIVTVLLYLGWTMAVLPYNAWGAELSDDYHHRTTVTAWREGCVVAGTLLAVTLPHAVGGDLLRVLTAQLDVAELRVGHQLAVEKQRGADPRSERDEQHQAVATLAGAEAHPGHARQVRVIGNDEAARGLLLELRSRVHAEPAPGDVGGGAHLAVVDHRRKAAATALVSVHAAPGRTATA